MTNSKSKTREDKADELREQIAALRKQGLGFGNKQVRELNLELRLLEDEEANEEQAKRNAELTPSQIVDHLEGLRGGW